MFGVEKYPNLRYSGKTIIWGSSNGRTVAFEAINWGSNPCPQARIFDYILYSEFFVPV